MCVFVDSNEEERKQVLQTIGGKKGVLKELGTKTDRQQVKKVYKIKDEELKIQSDNPLLEAVVFRIATQEHVK